MVLPILNCAFNCQIVPSGNRILNHVHRCGVYALELVFQVALLWRCSPLVQPVAGA